MTHMLALDTAGATLGVALLHRGELFHTSDETGPLRHVEQVVPRVDAALAHAGWRTRDLSAVAIAAGPGSFTGLRVGMAAAKAIALAGEISLVSVDTLLALAATERYRRGAERVESQPSVIVPVLDARKNRFYAAAFQNDPDLTRLVDDGDLTREELVEMVRQVARVDTLQWCAPGPMTDLLQSEPGYISAVTHHASGAPGAALIGYRRLQLQDGASDSDYQGPFYLRSGDIGKRGSVPRFAPTQESAD